MTTRMWLSLFRVHILIQLGVVPVLGFSSSSPHPNGVKRIKGSTLSGDSFVVVVGKVIIDDYRTPAQDVGQGKISVGGGGPQAAWGAAAALAVIDLYDSGIESSDYDSSVNVTKGSSALSDLPPPRQQPVIFLGPIGGDWSTTEQESIESILSPAIQSINLISESSLQTPRIQLWHNSNQEIQWQSLNDSWGKKGADSLWRNRPSAQDIFNAVKTANDGNGFHHDNRFIIDNLHMILEVGATAAGGGQDSELLLDERLLRQVKHVGIEPIAFPEEETGIVSMDDSISCRNRLLQYPKVDLVAPDKHLLEAVDIDSFWNKFDVAARYGPQGSRIWKKGSNTNEESRNDVITVPVASLKTVDGEPVNPTGAGNAFSAAISTCRAKGMTMVESACIATAIGAVFCEYEHVPPWTWETIHRIKQGVDQVTKKVAKEDSYMSTPC